MAVEREPAMTPPFEELRRDSLRAATMDNGLQTSAIYWETANRTYIPFLQPLSGKFTWKIVDDSLLKIMGHEDTAESPFVFYGNRQYFRNYHGHRDLHSIVPTRKQFNFSMNPTGTYNPLQDEELSSPGDIVSEIFSSAGRVDLKWELQQRLLAP